MSGHRRDFTSLTAKMIEVSQFVAGDTCCRHCTEDAVLLVRTEPDGEPGPACWSHAEPWLEINFALARKLFGPPPAPPAVTHTGPPA